MLKLAAKSKKHKKENSAIKDIQDYMEYLAEFDVIRSRIENNLDTLQAKIDAGDTSLQLQHDMYQDMYDYINLILGKTQ